MRHQPRKRTFLKLPQAKNTYKFKVIEMIDNRTVLGSLQEGLEKVQPKTEGRFIKLKRSEKNFLAEIDLALQPLKLALINYTMSFFFRCILNVIIQS